MHIWTLRLGAVNVWDAFCVLFHFVFEKVHIVFCSIHEVHFMIFGFCFVALYVMSHRVFVFPLLQNCTIDRYLQYVSRHAHVGRLRLSAVNVWDAFCVLFRTFVLKKFLIVFFVDP